jgi:hypothetical protein
MGQGTVETHGLVVNFDWWKASRGHRDKWGAPEEPDEPAEFEITKVTFNGTDITELLETFNCYEQLYEWVEEQTTEDELDYEADKADFAYECMKDERINYGEWRESHELPKM